MIGLAKAECLFKLGIEDPLAVFVGGLAVAQYLPSRGDVQFVGTLVRLGDLVVQAPLDLVCEQAVQSETVVHAEALASDRVIALAHAVRIQGTKAWDERPAHGAEQVLVAVVLEAFVGQAQAGVVGVVPAQLGQHVGSARIHWVGAGACKAYAAVIGMALGFVTVALAQVQQAVHAALTASHGGGRQPTVIG